MKLNSREIDDRVTYHPPDVKAGVLHERVREATRRFLHELAMVLPDCREASLAVTNAEQAMTWANAAIARNHHDLDELPLDAVLY